MRNILAEDRFQFVSGADKDFIISFDDAMLKIGYDFGGSVGSGYCWGRYMVIYSKAGAKNNKVVARVYIRDGGIVLRLFFSKIDAHRRYIESAPPHIKDVFADGYGDCHHCPDKKDGLCAFRKAYTLDGRPVEKWSDVAYEFWKPDLQKLPDYVGLLSEFYPARK